MKSTLLTLPELLRRAAEELRSMASGTSEMPWGYNSYACVFSEPRMLREDIWADHVMDAGHTIERTGKCDPCGDWQSPPHPQGDGCRYYLEHYQHVDSTVAMVPPQFGDTARGVHEANAQWIAAMNPQIADPLASWLEEAASAAEKGQKVPDGARLLARLITESSR